MSIVIRIGSHEIDYNLFDEQVHKISKWLVQFQRSSPEDYDRLDTNAISHLEASLDDFARVDTEDSQNLVARRYEVLQRKPKLSLEHALRHNRAFEATNARDFIYGIIAMTSVPTHVENTEEEASFGLKPSIRKGATSNQSSSLHSLPVDYARPLAQVFTEATVYLIQFHKSLDPIFSNFQLPTREIAPFSSSEVNDLRLASWATDWSCSSTRLLLDLVWILMDELVWRNGPFDLKSLSLSHIERENQKYKNAILKKAIHGNRQEESGGCRIRRPGVKWNDKETFHTNAGTRIVFGSENCSLFSAIRDVLYAPAEFNAVSEAGLVKLRCTGTKIGKLGLATEKRIELLAAEPAGNKIRFLKDQQNLKSVMARYFSQTSWYTDLVLSEPTKTSFKEMGVVVVKEPLYISDKTPNQMRLRRLRPRYRGQPYDETLQEALALPDEPRQQLPYDELTPHLVGTGSDLKLFYRSRLPIARYKDYNSVEEQDVWPVSHFCYYSDIGKILMASPSMVPLDSEVNDIVVMFRGCSLPAILREVPDLGIDHYKLIGPLLSQRYIAEEVLRRTTAEMWHKYNEEYAFDGSHERRPAPLEEDLPTKTFVLV